MKKPRKRLENIDFYVISRGLGPEIDEIDGLPVPP